MRFASFASGSSGNCSVLSAGQTHLMLDAGISNKRIEAGLAEAGLAFSDIGGICVTHEHIDHITGLRVFLKKHPTPVYATEGTLKGIETRFRGEIDTGLFRVIDIDRAFEVGGLTVTPFAVEHDAADPCSYRVTDGQSAFAIATDMGNYSGYTVRNLSGLDFLVLEANHDVRMLETGPYPYPLKRRIMSDLGHLSNETAGDLLAEVLNEKMDRVLLCHLSKENNYPALAREAVRLEAAEQTEPEAVAGLDIESAPREGMSPFYYF